MRKTIILPAKSGEKPPKIHQKHAIGKHVA
jgi:hypothetical protein